MRVSVGRGAAEFYQTTNSASGGGDAKEFVTLQTLPVGVGVQ